MKYDFKAIKLKDCCSFQEGYVNPSQSHPEYFGGSIKWIRAVDLNNANVYNTTRTLSEIGFRSAGKSALMFEPNTIVISKSGTIGRLGIIKDYMCGNRATINIKPKDNIDLTYLFYFLRSKQKEFEDLAVGSVQKNLYVSILEGIEISLPSLPLQRKIVSIVKDIDEKIELNNAINNNLFEQMQALYKAWFVDFEPFGGVRPSSWNDTNIYAIANIIYGAPFASKLFNTDGLGKPIIRIRDLKEQAFVTFTTEEHPKGHLIQPGDIVVGMDGEFRPYIWGNEPAWLNQRVCIFESNRPQGKAFVLYTIKPLLNKIEQTQVATTVIHIGKKDFDAFEIILPDEATLDSFDSITAPMIEQIVNNRLQNKRLAVLRDTLLPKLMSGELDVSDIDL